MKRRSNRVLLGVFCLWMPLAVWAQPGTPLLEKQIALKATQEPAETVLRYIAELADCRFSYNPSIIDRDARYNFSGAPISVREAIYRLFAGTVNIREKNGYVILQRRKNIPASPQQPDWMVYSGYVRDDSGKVVPWTSVYDRISLESTITNPYGYFSIRFKPAQLPLVLYFSKQGFQDTTVALQANSSGFIQVTLSRVPEKRMPPETPFDSLASQAMRNSDSFFERMENEPQTLNIRDTFYRSVQAAVIPSVGTAGKLAPHVISDYSFSLIGNYVLGVRKIDFSGMFSIVRGDAGYLQLSGFANAVGGSVSGVQVAGFTNLVRHQVKGVQVAGFVNTAWDSVSGVQLAGFVNTTRKQTRGVQIAGFVNTTLDSMSGFQLSGFANVTRGGFRGTQLSGFANVVSGACKGTQAGFVNVSRRIRGKQIGFVNYCDTIDGAAIGFLSIVKNGYHKIELSADEVLPFNLAFRSGTAVFYNILTAGLNPFLDSLPLWNFGYGFGTATRLGNLAALDLDLTCVQMVKGSSLEKINLVVKAYAGVDIRIAKKISLATGITLNSRIYNSEYSKYPELFSWYEPNIFYSNTWKQDHVTLDMWFGAKIGLRFL